MKRDWIQVWTFILPLFIVYHVLCLNWPYIGLQTGRKPSGICGAALYTAALAHGIKCSKTDIVRYDYLRKNVFLKMRGEMFYHFYLTNLVLLWCNFVNISGRDCAYMWSNSNQKVEWVCRYWGWKFKCEFRLSVYVYWHRLGFSCLYPICLLTPFFYEWLG